MSETKQLNTLVPPEIVTLVNQLQADHKHYGWGNKGQIVTTAVEALAELMKHHEKTAERAREDGVGELFLRLAHLMPAGFIDAKVEEARFSDGRPALIYKEEWVIAEDRNGDLMVVRRDGSQVGHIAHGQIKVLADLDTTATASVTLPSPEPVALN